jgi:hypothetical protein
MKRMLLLIVVFMSSGLVSIASIGTCISPVAAQDHGLQKRGNFLAVPTSSERFFGKGRRQLKQEIQRLQQGANAQASDVLKIDPTIFQQQQNLPQQEQQLLDRVGAPQNSTLPIEPL